MTHSHPGNSGRPVVASEPAAPAAGLPPGTLPRTAEMWRAEAVKLRGALEERKMLNQCLRLEVLLAG